jgi:two-component system, chemotaxis family, chemotaxis protein CheY
MKAWGDVPRAWPPEPTEGSTGSQLGGAMSIDHSVPILVVEDFSTMSRIICGLLKKAGFENVDAVQDGPAALAKMRETNYRLVISDWNMVPMNGYDLLNAIRSDEALAKTRFIMTTAEMSMNNAIAAKRAGVDSYLIKPFSAEAMKAKIEEAFAGKRH